MADPATTAASVAAAASAITMALFGVDHHSILYGFIGALIAVSQSQHSSRWRAVVSVVLSTFAGAALGAGVVQALGAEGKAALLLGCLVGGAGAQVLVMALVRAAEIRIDRMGDKS